MDIAKLQKIIKSSGVSIQELARVSDIDKSTLYRKLNGESEISVALASSLSKALALTPEEVNSIFFTRDSHKCEDLGE